MKLAILLVVHYYQELERIEKIIDKMCSNGVWPFIRQKPYDVIANPLDTPKSIFISGFDSSMISNVFFKL